MNNQSINITPKGRWVVEKTLQLQKEGMEETKSFEKALKEYKLLERK